MYKYKVKKEDFVKAHLYFISKSKKINIAFYSTFANAIIIISLMGIIYTNVNIIKKQFWQIVLIILSYVLLFFCYEFTQKRWYRLFYKEIINEKFGKDELYEVSIDFDDYYFYWIDNTGERNIIFSAIEKLVKTRYCIFIILKNKEVLPLLFDFEGFDDFINKLNPKLKDKGIEFIDDLNWKTNKI